MRFAHQHTRATLKIPPAQLAIATATDQQIVAWSPGCCANNGCLPHKTLLSLATFDIPYKQLASLHATASRNQSRSISTPGHLLDRSSMPHKLPQQCAISCVPQIH